MLTVWGPVETKPACTKQNPKRRLPDRQQAALSFIRSHVKKHGYAPTLRDISQHLAKRNGICGSASYAKQIVDALVHKGYLKRHPEKARAITVVGEEE